MTAVDVIGFVAGALVLTTFYVRTMVPLRTIGIVSNVAFIGYGLLVGAEPIIVLHVLLLPLNLYRLVQMRSLIRRIRRTARGNLSMEMFVPYMNLRTVPAGTTLFTKGDYAEEVFLILSGKVRIIGRDSIVKGGQLVGEMGLFTPDQKRTDSAICETEVQLASITEDKIWELIYSNPEFGGYLLRLVMHRTANANGQGPISEIRT